MCFSSSVSFGAGAVLSVMSVVAFSGARTLPQKALAAIPALFSLQQFAEGVVWLSLSHSNWARLEMPATYTFLVFAQILWPAYVPFCALLFEQNTNRKKIIGGTLIIGVALAIYTGIMLATHIPKPIADAHHIHYELGFALANKWYYGLLYFIPTIFSLLLSSKKILHLPGYLFLVSYLLTRLLFHFYVISVWCFFGALISMSIVLIIFKLNKKEQEANL